MVKLEGWKCI